MTRRDHFIAWGYSALSLIVCGIGYWFPPERYFDEVYYPRSAAEYLQWLPQYEWTHPPLTKLLIALSMLLFGGVNSPLGDTGYGWRFINVVIGAATVFLLYVFAKHLTKSTAFASIAAALLVLDGFHFTQSRIATPEITVAFFSLFILYAFCRYWNAAQFNGDAPPKPYPWKMYLLEAAIAVCAGCALAVGLIGVAAHQSTSAVALMAAFCSLAFYVALRLATGPRPRGLFWIWMVAAGCGLGAAAKWNTLFDLIVVFLLAFAIVLLPRPKWRIPLDAFAAIVLSTTIGLYLASYVPFFLTQHPATYESRHDLSGMMDLQEQMFYYHDVTVTHNAPHPYSSKWWEWPLLIQPVAYWYKDFRTGAALTNPNACCVGEILSLPNPLTWWFGLLSVPLLGYLAWVRRNSSYTVLFVAYFVQWLPWIASPRMLFEYHFYPNDAIILLADTVALQWFWERSQSTPAQRRMAAISIGCFVAATLALFVFFYPILSGQSLTWQQWHMRMWLRHWIIGPG